MPAMAFRQQRDRFFSAGKYPRSSQSPAADNGSQERPWPSSDLRETESLFKKRLRKLVAAACLGAVIHTITVGVSSSSEIWNAAGSDGREVLPAVHRLSPVQYLRSGNQASGELIAGGGTPNGDGANRNRHRGRRKLVRNTPLFSTLLGFGGSGGGGSTGGEEVKMEATALTADDNADDHSSASADNSDSGRGQNEGSRRLSSPLVDDPYHSRPHRAEMTSKAITAVEHVPQAKAQGQGHSESERLTTTSTTAHGAGAGSREGERSGGGREGGRYLNDAVDGNEHDTEIAGGGVCSALEIVGLDNCPELTPEGSTEIMERMLSAKADMLRQVIEVLTDPASPGVGGHPDEPLLLVQNLASDETDAIFGAFESRFLGHATDAGSWSPLPGGFNRWVGMYHQRVLHGTRPVLITVHGDDVCALEKELSLDARIAARSTVIPRTVKIITETSLESEMAQPLNQTTNEGSEGWSSADEKSELMPHLVLGPEENFEVPVVLMTLGWDPNGDPTHGQGNAGRDRSCAIRVLEMKRVVKWFTSHERHDSHMDEKFRYLPIGFGGTGTRNGLPQMAYMDAAKRQLEVLETCPVDQAGSYDLLFQCNAVVIDVRATIWKEMTEGKGLGSPVPVNRAPLEASDMVTAAAKGIFAVSPPGTGPDCFRHYEMMLEGNIALVPDVYSIRSFMEGLPAFFFGGRAEAWGSLTCGRLLEMAETVQAKIEEGKDNKAGRLQFEKLTHGFWRRYIRRETLLAGGASDDITTYVERSAVPMNPRGWTTFRQVGCFSPEEGHQHASDSPAHDKESSTTPSHQLESPERTPEGCAARCSTSMGGGVGFFGISSGNECWCDKVPGEFLSMGMCDIDCDGEEGGGSCGGVHASTVYVFGPEDRGAPFEYMGCFPWTIHVMYHEVIRLGKANTPFMCEALCTSIRYPFFSLENSEFCHCGVMTANTPRSDRVPAYIEGAGYEPVPGPPNATLAATPVPDGVQVGDPRFQCHLGRCGGSSKMWGCGAEKAYDLYRNVDPCMLYPDCQR